MSRAGVQTQIINPMQQLFLPPRQMPESQQREALGQYGDALEGFADDVLGEAWREIRATHTKAGWPPIAAFIAAAKAIIKARAKPEAPIDVHFSPAEAHRAFLRSVDRFCEHRGVSEAMRRVLLRPNLWWLRPRAEWERDWQESEIPPTYRQGGLFGRAPCNA